MTAFHPRSTYTVTEDHDIGGVVIKRGMRFIYNSGYLKLSNLPKTELTIRAATRVPQWVELTKAGSPIYSCTVYYRNGRRGTLTGSFATIFRSVVGHRRLGRSRTCMTVDYDGSGAVPVPDDVAAAIEFSSSRKTPELYRRVTEKNFSLVVDFMKSTDGILIFDNGELLPVDEHDLTLRKLAGREPKPVYRRQDFPQ